MGSTGSLTGKLNQKVFFWLGSQGPGLFTEGDLPDDRIGNGLKFQVFMFLKTEISKKGKSYFQSSSEKVWAGKFFEKFQPIIFTKCRKKMCTIINSETSFFLIFTLTNLLFFYSFHLSLVSFFFSYRSSPLHIDISEAQKYRRRKN